MLKNVKSKLTTGKKNILKISTGTVFGQLISLMTLPINARIYGPEIIGVWSLLFSICIIVKSISDLGMTHSIMIEDENQVEKTYKVITTTGAIISIISSALISIYYALFSEIIVNLIFLFVFITLLIFTTVQIQVCYTWLNRMGEYNILMKNPIINNMMSGLIAISLGVLGIEIYGYFIAQLAGQVLTLLHMRRKLPKGMFTLNKNNFKFVLTRNKKFVAYQMPANVFSSFKDQVPTLLINSFWGTEILGYYSIAVKVLQIPSTFLATAIGRVFFQTVSKLKREGKVIKQFVLRNIKNGIYIASIPMIMIMSLGDIVIVKLLGNDWKMAGDFIRLLTLQFFFMFIMNTIQGLSTVLEKQKYAMVTSISQIIGYILGAVLGKYIYGDIYITLILMSIFFIIIHIGYICSLLKLIDISKRNYIIYSILSVVFMISGSFVIRSSLNWIMNF